jgi:hypothetical protein
MLECLDDYDWKEVFGYAGSEDAYNHGLPKAVPFSSSPVDETPFSREDVAEIIGIYEGENDEENWVIAGVLKDGRYFMIEAGCDYTGWD